MQKSRRERASLYDRIGRTSFGVWLAARRLNDGRFCWPERGAEPMTLSTKQMNALVLGLTP